MTGIRSPVFVLSLSVVVVLTVMFIPLFLRHGAD
jgi:hypothetical protein